MQRKLLGENYTDQLTILMSRIQKCETLTFT